MNAPVLAALIIEAGPTALMQRDVGDKDAFHFLKYRNGDERQGPARSDDTIASLVVGVAKAEPSLVQFLLQQSAAHAFVAASRLLIDECNGQIDEASDFDPRTPRAIGQDAHDIATRAFYDNRDELQQIALDEQRRELDNAQQHAIAEKQAELLSLFELKDKEKRTASEVDRRALFEMCMIQNNSGGALVPFSLGAGELQAWLRDAMAEANETSKALHELVDLMGNVDGMTVLALWATVGFLEGGEANHGKLSKPAVSETLPPNAKFKMAALAKLAQYLGLERMQYYKAILLSCEKRSLLNDLDHVKFVGHGAFGRFATPARSTARSEIYCTLTGFCLPVSSRAHLCRNRHSGKQVVIKLLMPHGGQHSIEFARDVKETELQQRLGNSEFVASVFSWGTIDSTFLWVCMEFCEAGSLSSLISTKYDTIDRAKKNRWTKQLALGLLHMHDLSVMHRDIKPCNILIALDVRGESKMKYIDFGLALQVDNDAPRAYGRAGTNDYKAPELDDGLPYTLTVDCWSVGVAVFQLFTGTFQSAIPTHRFIQERKTTPADDDGRSAVFSSTANSGLDAETVAMLDLVLQGNPTKRASAKELVAFLVPLSAD